MVVWIALTSACHSEGSILGPITLDTQRRAWTVARSSAECEGLVYRSEGGKYTLGGGKFFPFSVL